MPAQLTGPLKVVLAGRKLVGDFKDCRAGALFISSDIYLAGPLWVALITFDLFINNNLKRNFLRSAAWLSCFSCSEPHQAERTSTHAWISKGKHMDGIKFHWEFCQRLESQRSALKLLKTENLISPMFQCFTNASNPSQFRVVKLQEWICIFYRLIVIFLSGCYIQTVRIQQIICWKYYSKVLSSVRRQI